MSHRLTCEHQELLECLKDKCSVDCFSKHFKKNDNDNYIQLVTAVKRRYDFSPYFDFLGEDIIDSNNIQDEEGVDIVSENNLIEVSLESDNVEFVKLCHNHSFLLPNIDMIKTVEQCIEKCSIDCLFFILQIDNEDRDECLKKCVGEFVSRSSLRLMKKLDDVFPDIFLKFKFRERSVFDMIDPYYDLKVLDFLWKKGVRFVNVNEEIEFLVRVINQEESPIEKHLKELIPYFSLSTRVTFISNYVNKGRHDLTITVSREKVYEEVLKELYNFFKKRDKVFPNKISFRFLKESARGDGVTMEILNLFVNSLAEKSCLLSSPWENESLVGFSDSNSEKMSEEAYVLGIVCAISLFSSNTSLPIGINFPEIVLSFVKQDLLWMDHKYLKEIDPYKYNYVVNDLLPMKLPINAISNDDEDDECCLLNSESEVLTYIKSLVILSFNKGNLNLVNKFREGFLKIVNRTLLSIVTSEELRSLIRGENIKVEIWKNMTTRDNTKIDKWFWEIVSELSEKNKISLLKYWSCMERLPFDKTKKPFLLSTKGESCISLGEKIENVENEFIRSLTCFKKLEVKNYKSKDMLRQSIEELLKEEIIFNAP